MPISLTSISGKYNALQQLEQDVGQVKAGTVEKVFTAAAKNKKQADALKSLLHFSGFSTPGTKPARLRARLGLVNQVAKFMNEGDDLSAAIRKAGRIDKAQLVQDCRDRYVAPTLNDEQVQALQADLEALAPLNQNRAGRAGSPDKLLRTHAQALERFSGYACTDVGSFPGNINKALSSSKRQEIKDRPTKMSKERQAADKRAQQATNLPRVSENTLKTVSKAVDDAQAGCCSTFAFAAAHQLTGGKADPNKERPRIEVLARQAGHAGTHCYVVVGRDPKSQLGKPDTWGKNARIIDPWLASLGHGGSFEVANYPYKGFLKATDQRYDSHGASQEVNLQADRERRMEALREQGLL